MTNWVRWCIIKVQREEKRKEMIAMITNINRLERHYLTEVQLTFFDKSGREMTEQELLAALAKLRAKKA